MARTDPFPVDRPLAVARRVFRLLVYTLGICVGVGLSILVLVGTLTVVRNATDSATVGSFAALMAFGLSIALPVYWLVVRTPSEDPDSE
jgi:hypothetical protein